ncbi:MAG: TIGR01440 family protein [Candidatus Heteroscillospira sp.]
MSNVTIKQQAEAAMRQLLAASGLKKGSLVVVGCSSSEIVGQKIGKGSSPEAAQAVVDAIMPILEENGLYLAAQCCEHLNRALIVEREVAERFGYEIVCVKPQPKAGGSFATAVYERMADPVAVEFVKASAGLDIGGTLIGMHLKHVAVPLRLEQKVIGEAGVQAARTRPKLIGGERAVYPD